jgi:carboxyl-terminal processing protease
VSLSVIRGSASDPHIVELTREAIQAPEVTSRVAAAGVGYVRVAALGAKTADQVRTQVSDLARNGAAALVVDVRRTSGGTPEHGLALARLFVGEGTLAMREAKGRQPEAIAARPADGGISVPVTLLADNGTSGAAEVFAAALVGNRRAELVGEHTLGRAAEQKLIKLADGSGLWLTTTRYLMPDGSPLHQRGLEPALVVEQPPVELGQPPPPGDPILEKALERISLSKAA